MNPTEAHDICNVGIRVIMEKLEVSKLKVETYKIEDYRHEEGEEEIEKYKSVLKGILSSQQKELEFLEKLQNKYNDFKAIDSRIFKLLLEIEDRIESLKISNKDIEEKIR